MCIILIIFVKREEIYTIFEESMKNKEEGIVVKKCNTKYKPNVRDGIGCYKIKAEVIFSLFLIFIYKIITYTFLFNFNNNVSVF